jgi:hypothetical protein
MAVLLMQCGAAAVAFSVFVPHRLGFRLSLVWGILYSLVAHWVAYRFVWGRLSPHLEHFAPPELIWTAAVLFGACLAFSPWLIRSLGRQFLLE